MDNRAMLRLTHCEYDFVDNMTCKPIDEDREPYYPNWGAHFTQLMDNPPDRFERIRIGDRAWKLTIVNDSLCKALKMLVENFDS